MDKRSIQRLTALRLIPDVTRVIANGPYDNHADLKRLASWPPERQMAFARAVQSRREEKALFHEVQKDAPVGLRLLDHALLDVLDEIGRNDTATRRHLATMERDDMIEAVTQMKRESVANGPTATAREMRVRARPIQLTGASDTMSAAWDVASHADRSKFLEVHGLRKATTIPGKCVSLAFGAVEEDIAL